MGFSQSNLGENQGLEMDEKDKIPKHGNDISVTDIEKHISKAYGE